MLAFSTSVLTNSNIEWLSAEEPFSYNHNQNYFNKESMSSSEYAFPQQPQPQVEVERPTAPSMVRKLSHNASERNRRIKINTLITLLHSLLPVADRTKKMSIQAILSRAARYIPELLLQMEGLTKKKEELLWRSFAQGDHDAMNIGSKRKRGPHDNSDFIVSTSRLNDTEATIHISSYDEAHYKTPLSKILLYLENNGHYLMNASSSETFEGRVFYNLHFQVEKDHALESDILHEKLLAIHEKKQRILYSNYDQTIFNALL